MYPMPLLYQINYQLFIYFAYLSPVQIKKIIVCSVNMASLNSKDFDKVTIYMIIIGVDESQQYFCEI